MKKQLLVVLLLAITNISFTQSVGINTTSPDASAALDVTSTTQGMLVPRMTQAQRTAISNPATGLLVYQTDATAGFYFYNGAWQSLSGGQGPKGDTGATGPQGPQGPAGNDGATGAQGPQGPAGNDGATGAQGPQGPAGNDGANGQGVPAGGTANQILAKVDGTDYNTSWVTPSAGGTATTDNATLQGNGTSSSVLKIKDAGVGATQLATNAVETAKIKDANVTVAKIAPSATNGQVLTTTGGAVAWETPASSGGGGIPSVTEAAKNAMTTAANGTLVYQTDGYKGIYAKESDGWRMQSGDTPITFIDVDSPPTTYPVVLNASNHTIYIHGSWNTVATIPNPITLPNATACKGRIYKIVVNNGSTDYDINNTIEIVNEFGWPASMTNTNVADHYIKFDHDFSSKRSQYFPAGRMVVIQSNGTDWVEIQNDKTESDHLLNGE